MPRYFFNTNGLGSFSDQDGSELADLQAACSEASRLAGEILKYEGEAFWQIREWHLDVSDESGSVLFSLDISASGAKTD